MGTYKKSTSCITPALASTSSKSAGILRRETLRTSTVLPAEVGDIMVVETALARAGNGGKSGSAARAPQPVFLGISGSLLGVDGLLVPDS